MLEHHAKIGQLYQPIQPAVKLSAAPILYDEFPADAALADTIYCYWQLRTTEALPQSFRYRVVADGCTDIFFEPEDPEKSYVMGFCGQSTEFPLDQTFHYIGVRFLPAMFTRFFYVNALEINNRCESLHSVVPGLSLFIRQYLHAGMHVQEIKNVLDRYFLKLLSTTSLNSDARLSQALSAIIKSGGMLDIEKDLADMGVSPRQLRRLFQFHVGGSPKTFSKIVRFQTVLKTDPSLTRTQQDKLFFDAGYYDQAHFIKEFKNFYGLTPGQAQGI